MKLIKNFLFILTFLAIFLSLPPSSFAFDISGVSVDSCPFAEGYEDTDGVFYAIETAYSYPICGRFYKSLLWDGSNPDSVPSGLVYVHGAGSPSYSGEPFISTYYMTHNSTGSQYKWVNSTWVLDTTESHPVKKGFNFYDQFYSNADIHVWFTGVYNPSTFTSSYSDLGTYSSGDLLAPQSIQDGSLEEPISNFKWYIKYHDFNDSTWYRKIYSNTKCSIDISTPDSSNYPLLDCTDSLYKSYIWHPPMLPSVWELEDPSMASPFLLDTPSSPSEYCDRIVESNYSIRDQNGNALCQATNNPVVEDLLPSKNVISWVPPSEDWGVWEFMKGVMQTLFDSIDTIWNSFIDLYSSALTVIIPNPDDIPFYMNNIKTTAQNNLPTIDVSGIENFSSLSPDSMDTVNVVLFGLDVPILDFSLFTNVYSSIQPIAISIFSFGLLYFNVNQLNKLLSDTSIT